MCKIGYIISKRQIKDVPSFVGVVNSIEEVDDANKPVLIVGYKESKKIIGDKFNILKKKINDKLFWTFLKTEKRVDYDNDISDFYEYCIKKEIETIKYYYVNILTISLNKAKSLLSIINSNEKKYIYICGDMIYIYYKDYVLGVSLRVCKYSGFSVKKVLSKIHKNKANIISYNDSFLDLKMKKTISNKKYVTPYFMKMDNIKNYDNNK